VQTFSGETHLRISKVENLNDSWRQFKRSIRHCEKKTENNI